MVNYKRAAAGVLAALMAMGLTACGSSEEPVVTTTQATVPINTAELSEEESEQMKGVADLLTGELENKTIKWMSFYDPFHATTSGNTKSLSLELFEEKYDGVIEYYETTWQDRFDKLAVFISSGEGIDFIPGGDLDSFPNCVINGMLVPVDEYIDYDNELWSSVKNINDKFTLNGKHYLMATAATTGQVVYYNRQTIEAYGLDDPADQLEEGTWTWDAFKQDLLEFCDVEAGNYGLDGWFNEKPLMMTSGAPALEIRDGKLADNFYNADLERAMNFQRELFDYGLILDKNLTGWQTHIEYIGEGKELFYISGLYEISASPDIWTLTFGDAEDVMFVPLPKDPNADSYYLPAGLEAYMLCKGSQNPEGVAKFMECCIAASSDERAQQINRDKFINDFGWSEEMLAMKDKIDAMTAEHPVFDLCNGVQPDLNSLVDSGQTGVRAAFQGGDWATVREALSVAADILIDEFNSKLEAMS
ncbi:MAG: ABC transporter substrate-binding protein [Oscillospiraceae bacterium]